MPARYTRELLEQAARETTSWDEAVRWCGKEPTQYSKRYLSQRMKREGIDTSHFVSASERHSESLLRELVASSLSVKEVVRRLGISNVGGNQTHIARRIAAFGIDTSHFRQVSAGRTRRGEDCLTMRDPARGRVPGERLRSALLRSGVPEQCARCGIGTEWNGKVLRHEVDHISGDWWDNRPENLRLLCPNCHSITDTYRGRNRGPKS
ncbi:HNH endonuclease [Streptomyces sp. NPDC060194]|uniref:HNH endonuclease n=1 Tax=Streptomyces sp. NPDC060194 TaxID=3347069 RepID=UPI003653C736